MQAAARPMPSPADLGQKNAQAADRAARLPPVIRSLLQLEDSIPGLHVRSVALLAMAHIEPGLSTREYARALGASTPAITRHAQALMKVGLLVNAGNEKDKRLTAYRVTPAGLDELRTLMPDLPPAKRAKPSTKGA